MENWHNITKGGENSDCNSNLVTKDLMHHAGRNRDHSCMENFHEDDIYPHNMNKHSCTYQSLPEHQVSKLCEYLTKRHIKSYQHMEGLNAFSNYVKTTLNLGSSDRIPSTTPGAEPPRDAKDPGSARSHSTHLETSSSNRP